MPTAFPMSRLALIVDDDEEASALLSRLLQLHGFRVLTATHGADAVRWLDDASILPSIILLDMDMPVMDGGRFLVHREQREWRTVPVIVVSGDRDLAERIEGFEVHLHRKPVRPTRLMALIEHVLRSSSARRGSGGGVDDRDVLDGAGPQAVAGAGAVASAVMAADATAAPTEPPVEASPAEPPDPAAVRDPAKG